MLTPAQLRERIEGMECAEGFGAYRLFWEPQSPEQETQEPHVKVYLVEMLMHQLENIVASQERITSSLMDALGLENVQADEDVKQLVTLMNRTASLHQVLLQSMSNITSDEHDGPCKLHQAAQLAGELYASELRMGQIQLDIRIEPNITLDIPNNVAILVLCNLLSNAKDAIRRGGTIYIEAKDDEDAIRCCITDDGEGIDPDSIEHIFDLGFTTKGARRGSGLTLSARVLERSGAQIKLTSPGPGGTTFTVYLPKQKRGE